MVYVDIVREIINETQDVIRLGVISIDQAKREINRYIQRLYYQKTDLAKALHMLCVFYQLLEEGDIEKVLNYAPEP